MKSKLTHNQAGPNSKKKKKKNQKTKNKNNKNNKKNNGGNKGNGKGGKNKNKGKHKGKKDNGKYGSGKHVTSRTTSQSTSYTSGTSGTSEETVINTDSDTAVNEAWKAKYPGYVYVQQTITDTQSVTGITETHTVVDNVVEQHVDLVRNQDMSSPFSQSTGLGPFQAPHHVGDAVINGEDQIQEFFRQQLVTTSEVQNLGMSHSSTTDANRSTKVAKHTLYRHRLKRKKFNVILHKSGTRRITQIVRNISVVARTGYSPWHHMKTLLEGTQRDFATSHSIKRNNDNTFTVTTTYWNYDPATVGGGTPTAGWAGTKRKDTWSVPSNESNCLNQSLPKTTATIIDSSYPVARSGYATVPLILDSTKTPMTSSAIRQTMVDILYFLFSVHYRFDPHKTKEIRIDGNSATPFGFSVTVIMDVYGDADPAKGVFTMVPIAYQAPNSPPPGITSWDVAATVRMTCEAQHIVESFDVPDGWVQT